MQIDSELTSTVVAVATSLIESGACYGIIRTKIERLDRDMSSFEKRFVSHEVFKAVIDSIKDDLHEMRSDIKQVLNLTRKRFENDSN